MFKKNFSPDLTLVKIQSSLKAAGTSALLTVLWTRLTKSPLDDLHPEKKDGKDHISPSKFDKMSLFLAG